LRVGAGFGQGGQAIIEATGNVTPANAPAGGINSSSIGGATHSAAMLEIGLDFGG
jgi:nicotinate-nucleotide pyrophosphorylase